MQLVSSYLLPPPTLPPHTTGVYGMFGFLVSEINDEQTPTHTESHLGVVLQSPLNTLRTYPVWELSYLNLKSILNTS